MHVDTSRRLVADEPDNANWRHKLADSLYQFGNAQGGKGPERRTASVSYMESRALLDPLFAKDSANKQVKSLLSSVNFNLSFQSIFGRQFSEALSAAERAVELAEDDYGRVWPAGNKAHALMFLDRRQEARALYRQHASAVIGNRSWAAGILDDFRQFRAAAITHPLMEEVETLMNEALQQIRTNETFSSAVSESPD